MRCYMSPSSTEPEGFQSGPRTLRAVLRSVEAWPESPRFQAMKPRRNHALAERTLESGARERYLANAANMPWSPRAAVT
jgi:hypothetical protein